MALLSPKDIAKKYGYHETHITRLARAGLIKFKKFGRYYVIDEKSLKFLKHKWSRNRIKKKEINHHEDMGN